MYLVVSFSFLMISCVRQVIYPETFNAIRDFDPYMRQTERVRVLSWRCSLRLSSMTPKYVSFFLGFPSFILANSGIVNTLSTLATVPTTLSQLRPSLYTCCELMRASLHDLQIKYYIFRRIRRVVFPFNTSK